MLKLSKYQTIDPLILQTLNLNQRRMSHILSILHGNPPQVSKKSPLKHSLSKKSNLKDFNFHPTNLHKNSTNLHKNPFIYQTKTPLPKINDRTKGDGLSLIQEKIMRKNKLRGRNFSTVQYRKDQINEEIMQTKKESINRVRSHRKHNILTQNQEEQGNKFSQLLKQKQASYQKHRKSSRVTLLLQQQKECSPMHKIRSLHSKNSSPSLASKSRLLSDYLSKVSLKSHKSLSTINPKDVYRYEIQQIMKEMTEVSKLEDAERRMKRVKRRHQHLVRFDRQYYAKLNRLELENCQYQDQSNANL